MVKTCCSGVLWCSVFVCEKMFGEVELEQVDVMLCSRCPAAESVRRMWKESVNLSSFYREPRS